MKTYSFGLLSLFLALFFAAGCGVQPLDPLEEIPVSIEPSELPEQSAAILGRVFDFETGAPIANAFISTAPSSTIIRTTARGEFVLHERLETGEIYRIFAEADGYSDQYAMALANPGRTFVDIALVSTDRSLPVVFDPFTSVFTPSLHALDVSMFSRDGGTLNWSVRTSPDWLEITPREGELPSSEDQRLRLSLVPEEFDAAIRRAEFLQGRVHIQDDRNRIALFYVLAIAGDSDEISFQIIGEDEVDVGSTLTLRAEALYKEAGIAGATFEVEVQGSPEGLVPTAPFFVAGNNTDGPPLTLKPGRSALTRSSSDCPPTAPSPPLNEPSKSNSPITPA